MNKLFAIFLFIINSPLLASCPGLALSNLPNVISLNNNINPQINFRVTRQDLSTECDYKVGFDRGSAPNYARKLYNQSNTLDFTLSKDVDLNSILKDVLDGNNASEYLKGKFQSSDNPKKLYKDHHFYAGLTLNPNVPAGTYIDNFLIKLYDDNNGVYSLIESRSIQFYYGMPSQVALSIVNTNAAFDAMDTSQQIDFGTLTQGESQSFDVVIQSSNGYRLEISSANSGSLKHITANQNIQYIFRVNGQIQNLSGSNVSPVVVSTGLGNHPSDGFRVPLQFEVGSTTNKLSGTYHDTLTLTVTSNL